MIGGVDEAGRGPVIGPLVIAGVNFQNDLKLRENGVKDSKKLSPSRRIQLAGKIKELADNFEVIKISAQDIDDMRRVMTLNEIEVNAFSKIIEKLKPDICYVDAADVKDERFGKDIQSKLTFKPEIISKHKADEIYPIVGAASIIAKTTRDYEISIIESDLRKKLDIPMGSGYPADPITQNFLNEWLIKFGKLPPHTRHSWKTSQKLLDNYKTRKLDSF
ncbi:MAG: ribonuclease HII [Candidatus Thermoplasmatota archaeon]|nr:ribonuclease HII [Candidatus Thermoplasmatota archaeon]